MLGSTAAVMNAAGQDLTLRDEAFQLVGLTGIVGGGKDTQTKLLRQIPGLYVVIMSEELDRRGLLTNRVGLSSDEDVNHIVGEMITHAVHQGYLGLLINGWPRTGPQSEKSLDIAHQVPPGFGCPGGINVAVIELTTDDDEAIVRRLLHRGHNPVGAPRKEDASRDDILQRIRTYRERSEGVRRCLGPNGLLQEVDCLLPPEEVHCRIVQSLRIAEVLSK